MQGFSSESSRTGRSNVLQIPETLGGRAWTKWTLPLDLFVGLARQSASLWVVGLWYDHHISPSPLLLLTLQVSADAADVRLAACGAVNRVADLLMDCLEVGAVILIVAEFVAVVVFCVAEVSPHRLRGGATFHDTSWRVGVGAGEVVGVDLRHYPTNIYKVAVFPLKVGLTDSVVLSWKALQDNVLVLAVRGALLGSGGIEVISARILLLEKAIEVFI